MTKILMSGFDPELEIKLEQKLIDLGNDVDKVDKSELINSYGNYLPDVLLMDFTDMEESNNMARDLIEFDGTTCIFAVADKANEKENDMMYKSGVRVVLDRPGADFEEFLDSLYGACNDLEHENCIGCWKLNRYDNLQKLV